MLTASPSARFFGAGEALAQLIRIESLVSETGAIPSDVHLGGVYDGETVKPVLKHLIAYWSDDAPERSAQRRQTATRMTVLHGMSEILAALDPANSDALDFSDPGAGLSRTSAMAVTVRSFPRPKATGSASAR